MLTLSFLFSLCIGYFLYITWKDYKDCLKMYKEFPIGSRFQVFEKTINNIPYYSIFYLAFRGCLLSPKWQYHKHYVSKDMAYHNCLRLNEMQKKDYERNKFKVELKDIGQYRKL